MKTTSTKTRRLLSALLCVCMVLSLLPAIAPTVEVEAATTPTYIAGIAVAYGAKESTPKNILTGQGYTVIDYDLNKDCGASSHYIYMGYKTTTDPSEAITGIFFRTGSNPPSSATFDGVTAYLLGGSGEANPGEDTYVDLNADAGGDYIYTYVTRDTSRAPLIEGMYFDSSSYASGYVTPGVDLNAGTGDQAIYLHYKQFSETISGTVCYISRATGVRYSSTFNGKVTNHTQSVTTPVSFVLGEGVYYNNYQFHLKLAGWRDDTTAAAPEYVVAKPSVTYMTSGRTYYAVYENTISLSYDANGGTGAPGAQSVMQYFNIGSSNHSVESKQITLSTVKPTHDDSKCVFLGWSTSSTATTAAYQPGQTITISDNTTLYAVWRTNHTSSKTYVNNGSNHTYTWPCCGKSVTEAHSYNAYGFCTCGDENPDAVAMVSRNDRVTGYYTSLEEAINAVGDTTASDKAMVTLLQDINLGDGYQEITSGVFTIELNGCMLRSTNAGYGTLHITGGDVTVVDSGTNGKIIGNYSGIYATDSTLTVGGGAISGGVSSSGSVSSSAISVNVSNSELTLTGGNIGTQAIGTGLQIKDCNVTILDVTVNGHRGLYAAGSIVSIDGGNFNGHNCAVYVLTSAVEINDGTINGNLYGVNAYDSGVEINGGVITSTHYGISGDDGSDITVRGGSISGGDDIYTFYQNVTLDVGNNGVGATFPGGVQVDGTTLNALLGEGVAYWQEDTMILPADDATEITGDVVIKSACPHTAEKFDYTDLKDGTSHSYICSDCNSIVTEVHTYTDGLCVCGAYVADAVASVSKNGTVVGCYADIEDAFYAVKFCTEEDNAVVKLLENIDWSDGDHYVQGVLTLDLNGKTLHNPQGTTLYITGTCTIDDTSPMKDGVVSSQSGDAVNVGAGGYLILSNGQITAPEGHYAVRAASSGTGGESRLTINGGTVIGMTFTYGTAEINGGVFKGVVAFSTTRVGSNVKGGTFEGGFRNSASDTKPLKDYLAEGYAFCTANGRVLDLADDTYSITEPFTVRIPCQHDGDWLEATCITPKSCAICGTPSKGLLADHTLDENNVCTVCGCVSYNIWLGGVEVDSENVSDILGDGTASYDPATNTLTLNGTTVDMTDINLAIHEETLERHRQELANGTLSGTPDFGSLIPALVVKSGNVTLELKGDNSLTGYYGLLALEMWEYAYYGCPAISIGEDAALTVTGDDTATLTLSGNDLGYTRQDHIPSASAITGSSLTVSGGTVTTENGIRLTGSYTQIGGNVTAGYWETENFTMSGGTLNARGESGIRPVYIDANAGGIHGIFAREAVVITGGTVTTGNGRIGHNGEYRSETALLGETVTTHGIYALGSVTITGGTVTATGCIGGYFVDDVGVLVFGGYKNGQESTGNAPGAALEAPQWTISEDATFICGSDTSHRKNAATCVSPVTCKFCGTTEGEVDPYNHTGDLAVRFDWPETVSDYMSVYAQLYYDCCGAEADWNWSDAQLQQTAAGTDCMHPGSAIYSVSVEFNGDPYTYTDTHTYIIPSDNHIGQFVNGFCSACGGYEAAVWNEEKGVYEISNAGQLYWYAQYLNTTNAEVYAELTADIEIPENAPNWEPINASYVYFNGNFHTISGLKCIGDENMTYVGLFGCEGWWYEISNLHITNSYFEGTEYVGAVVACMTNGGSVTNCYVTNTTVKGDYYAVGGLIGNLSSSHAINCFSTATVIGAEGNVLIGSHSVGYGSIENCYFLGTEDNYDGTTAMTAEDFAGGKVAYLLQSAIQGEDIYDEETGEWIGTAEPKLIWGQTIGEDAFPVFGGEKVYQVTDCDGETGYRNVNVSGHIFKDATCTDPKTCKVCGETEGEALGHKWAAATCTAPKTCSVCGATEGDALGHDWIDATCTTPKTCDICGATEGDAPGHSYDNGFCVRCDDYEAATGSGTAADPYKIGNAGQLYWFAAQINGGNTGIYGQLTADIVVNTNVLGADFALNEGTYRSWTPIGSNASPYTGTFDGKEFTISGLYFEQGGQMYIGLFGRSKGTIQNVGVKDSFFYASSHIGAIAGCNDGTIRNCFNSGYVCGNWNVAGIVGMNYGDIFNCRNSGKIAGDWKEKTNPENRQIGGIAGYSDVDTLITDCRNTGDISGKNEVGGIVGKYYMMLDVHGTGSVSGCYNSGTVIGAENKVGGIVGEASVNITDCHNSGNICGKTSVGGIQGQGSADLNGEPYDVTDCSNLGEITGTGSNVGGISGYGYNTFRCFNSGAITGNSNVGGITGFSYLNITNCYNTGSVSGTKDVGGLAGTSDMMITNCYNTGVITAETNAGGIVGFQDPLMEWVCIINCYYLAGTAAVGSNSQFEVGTAEEKADFANGEVAYLLSQGQNGDVWGQTIGQDAIPNFTGMTVYPVLDCKDEIAGYSNTEGEKLGHSEPEYINNGDTHTIDYPCCDALDVTGQAHTYGDNFHCVCGKVCPDGIFETSNGDLYYVENGAAVENKGLVQVIDENGLIVYYYFGCGIEGCSAGEACQGNFKAQRSSRHYVNNTNGYLVEGGYTFNADGTIEHFENRQGIQTIDGTKFYLIDGVKVAAGLVEIDGEFYYVRSSGALVIGQDYYVSKPNGLTRNGEEIKKGTYTFDAEGRIDWTLKNGIYAEDGSLYYYVDDVRTYAGLILYTGDLINADGSVTAGVYNNAMIYVNTHGEVKNNCTYWISKNNGLIEKNRAFTFDANGIAVIVEEKDGFCFENGAWYYYVDGKLNYAGLIWCDGPEGNDPGYYYINSKGMLITDCTYWISKNNGHMGNQAYTFGENGKMVQKTNDSDALLNGIVEENGELYYYENGVRTYKGLIIVDGNYYYANSEGQIVRNGQYWISRTNGYMKPGSYIFDGDGILIPD